ncbi:MAG: hypothetical protein HW399_324 [Dehalococcoidia bacterium]|nr:hypothetical protein [Dehalococcoidia bacterium]
MGYWDVERSTAGCSQRANGESYSSFEGAVNSGELQSALGCGAAGCGLVLRRGCATSPCVRHHGKPLNLNPKSEVPNPKPCPACSRLDGELVEGKFQNPSLVPAKARNQTSNGSVGGCHDEHHWDFGDLYFIQDLDISA